MGLTEKQREDLRHIRGVVQDSRYRIFHECNLRQVTVGFKLRSGKITSDLGIVAFTQAKLSRNQLNDRRILPLEDSVKGVLTDVVEVPGGFYPRSERKVRLPEDSLSENLTKPTTLPAGFGRSANFGRQRPFKGGDAGIHFAVSGSGTFAIVNKDSEILTNNHVGANEDVEGGDFARQGDVWLQPGAHGGATASDAVAVLDRWNKIAPVVHHQDYRFNMYDAAIGRVLDNLEEGTDFELGQVRKLGNVEGAISVDVGDEVTKMGARTEVTKGIVTHVFVPGAVTRVGPYHGHDADFALQLVIQSQQGPFSGAGDSGSLILRDEKDKGAGSYKAAALLFAGGTDEHGSDLTIASPIIPIIHNLKFKL